MFKTQFLWLNQYPPRLPTPIKILPNLPYTSFPQPWISHFPLSNLFQGEIGFLKVVAMYSLIWRSASSFIPFCKIQCSQSPLWSAGVRVRGLATLAFFLQDFLCHIVSHINELTYSYLFLCVLFQYVFPTDLNFSTFPTSINYFDPKFIVEYLATIGTKLNSNNSTKHTN